MARPATVSTDYRLSILRSSSVGGSSADSPTLDSILPISGVADANSTSSGIQGVSRPPTGGQLPFPFPWDRSPAMDQRGAAGYPRPPPPAPPPAGPSKVAPSPLVPHQPAPEPPPPTSDEETPDWMQRAKKPSEPKPKYPSAWQQFVKEEAPAIRLTGIR